MRLFIIETGGTIASKREGATIDLEKTPMLDRQTWMESGVSVAVRRPFYSLSENLTPMHWIRLAQAVRSAVAEGAEGILVLHGSDTLPYTAAALCFLLSDLSVPVAITAANRPPDEENSNAEANVKASVRYLNAAERGISVLWQNPDGVMRIYDPRRLTEAIGDAFYAAEGGETSFNNIEETQRKGHTPLLPCPSPEEIGRFVGVVRPMPGLDYSKIVWQSPPAAVLHTLYHSGTACAQGENTSFEWFKNKCRSENLPLYICPARRAADGAYASAEVLQGAVPLFDLSPEAAYVLLTLAYNQTAEPPETVLKRLMHKSGKA